MSMKHLSGIGVVAGLFLSHSALASGSSSTFSAGYAHAAAISQSDLAFAWGYGDEGQLGLPPGVAVRVAASGNTTAWLLSDGSVVAYGAIDDQGEPPTQTNFIDVVTNGRAAVALRSDGTLRQWGRFFDFFPPAGTYTKVAGAGSNFYAIRTDGSLAAWGFNFGGELDVPPGNDYIALSNLPAAIRADGSIVTWRPALEPFVPEGPGFHSFGASGGFVVALRRNGVIYAEGETKFDGPVQGPLGNDFVAVTYGGEAAFAIRANGELVAFGSGAADEMVIPTGLLVKIPDDALVPCTGDATGDFAVDFADLNAALTSFGLKGAPGFVGADVTGDGDVDFADINLMLSEFGKFCQ